MNRQMKTPSTISYGCLYQNILWQRYQHDDSCIKSLVLFVQHSSTDAFLSIHRDRKTYAYTKQ